MKKKFMIGSLGPFIYDTEHLSHAMGFEGVPQGMLTTPEGSLDSKLLETVPLLDLLFMGVIDLTNSNLEVDFTYITFSLDLESAMSVQFPVVFSEPASLGSREIRFFFQGPLQHLLVGQPDLSTSRVTATASNLTLAKYAETEVPVLAVAELLTDIALTGFIHHVTIEVLEELAAGETWEASIVQTGTDIVLASTGAVAAGTTVQKFVMATSDSVAEISITQTDTTAFTAQGLFKISVVSEDFV